MKEYREIDDFTPLYIIIVNDEGPYFTKGTTESVLSVFADQGEASRWACYLSEEISSTDFSTFKVTLSELFKVSHLLNAKAEKQHGMPLRMELNSYDDDFLDLLETLWTHTDL